MSKRAISSKKIVIVAKVCKQNKLLTKVILITMHKEITYYLNAKKWDSVGNKTKKAVPNYIKKCVKITNDLPIDQVRKYHATQMAEKFDVEDKAKAIIRTYVQALSGFLE